MKRKKSKIKIIVSLGYVINVGKKNIPDAAKSDKGKEEQMRLHMKEVLNSCPV